MFEPSEEDIQKLMAEHGFSHYVARSHLKQRRAIQEQLARGTLPFRRTENTPAACDE